MGRLGCDLRLLTLPYLTFALLESALNTRASRPLVVIDLGVPRNVDATATLLPNLHLCDIDHLTEIVEQNKQAHAEEIPRAEEIIEEHITNFKRWHSWGGHALHGDANEGGSRQ